ncbi:MAG: D-alanyl-D-alanine carboxypeptidase family protein [Paracoccaceae bacterium]
MRLALLLLIAALPAQAFDTKARAAWVYDLTTDTVLLEKNAHQPLPPASMSKLMTINMLFEALHDGRVALDDRFAVSSAAKAMEGSTMFLNEQDRPTVEELIQGIVVLSGNDACVVVAEGLAGTEAGFAEKMNQRAKALGMTDSHFANASGWPDPNHLMSMHDLGILAARLITEFPEYYQYFSLTEFPYDGRSPDNRFNRNPLLKMGIGADGLKTGHTQEAGYGLVGSAEQNGRRIVFVLSGLASEKDRAEEARRMADWAFREFSRKTVAEKGTKIADAPVWMGAAASVGLVVDQDLDLLLPSLVDKTLTGAVHFDGPVMAPVTAGARLGELMLDIPGHDPVKVALVAGEDVAKGGFVKRIGTAFGIVASRLMAEIGS